MPSGAQANEIAYRPSYRAAAVASAAVLLLYVVTLGPSSAMWDTSEYIAVARVLGMPHPPGNPTFVLIAHVAGLVPLPVEYAVRINLLAAVSSAASAALWFLCADWMMRRMIPERRWRLAAAVAGAFLGATAFTVWNQSVVNEKVYTVSLLGLALGSWLLVRWLATDDEARGDERRGRRPDEEPRGVHGVAEPREVRRQHEQPVGAPPRRHVAPAHDEPRDECDAEQ